MACRKQALWPKVSPSVTETAKCSGIWTLFSKTASSVFANPHHRPGRFFPTNPLAASIPINVSRFSRLAPHPDHLYAMSPHHLPAQAPHPHEVFTLMYHSQHEAGDCCIRSVSQQ